MLKGLYCGIAGHRVNRRRVWHDQLNFRTSCTRCNRPLLRDNQGWREFDSAHHADVGRDPHPDNVRTNSD